MRTGNTKVASSRKPLGTIEGNKVDKENVGIGKTSTSKDIGSKSITKKIPSESSEPTEFHTTAVQTDRNDQLDVNDLISSGPPSDTYWKMLAEQRLKALEKTLKENEELHMKVERLEKQKSAYKEMLDETNALVEILKEMIENNDLSEDDNDLDSSHFYMEAIKTKVNRISVPLLLSQFPFLSLKLKAHQFTVHILGFQQTIPSMIRMREERSENSKTPSGYTRSVKVEGMVNRTPLSSSSSRANPYKVPFQRRQPMEPIYADPAPLLMPQAMHLSPAFGLGSFYAGTNSLFMPTVQQNLLEVPFIPYSNQTEVVKENTGYNIDGLTSSPPNQSEPDANDAKSQPTGTKSVTSTADFSIKDIESKKINDFKISMNHRNNGLRILTGSIEKVIKWEQMWTNKKEKPLLFEVIAPLLQVQEGLKPNEKQLLLRESGGPVLSVMFYEIDREVPQLTRGQYVRCVCRSLGKRRFQAYSVRIASQQEHSSLQRLSFLCHRALQEALLSIHEA
ncbi:hypothetical protein J437_LFUL001147 [Ladona fulva]|uniref:Uncharacterized protein n=1 Tax=Ladona fulva TaxID=123851 RepID=A0A8K0JYC7_LADFU|nr:hypothetical protein J437_LFUL001147 [Ladona fulva]